MPVGYSAFCEVVRRELHSNPVAGQDLDEVLAHLARQVSQNRVSFAYLDFEGRVGQRFYHGPLDGDHLILWNSITSCGRLFINIREKNSALSCVMLDDYHQG